MVNFLYSLIRNVIQLQFFSVQPKHLLVASFCNCSEDSVHFLRLYINICLYLVLVIAVVSKIGIQNHNVWKLTPEILVLSQS